MNWEAITAISEILGTIVTVATLFYLAVQIRHGQKTNQAATEYDANMQFAKFCERTVEDRDLERIWDMALRSDPNLNEDDAMHITWHICGAIYAAEAVWRQYKNGFLSQEIWINWERFCVGMLQIPIIRRWWDDRITLNSPDFIAFIDKLLVQQPEWKPQDPKSWISQVLKEQKSN